MLLMGIIRELSSQSAKVAPCVSHFFCQGTDTALNSATAALRSLIWLLLVQQPHLISHLRSKHKNAGASLFRDDSAFIALSTAFESVLKNSDLFPVYFIVDALDECEQGLPGLIQLISDSFVLTEKVKWLVSSRPIVELSRLRVPRVPRSSWTLKSWKTCQRIHQLQALRLRRPTRIHQTGFGRCVSRGP